MINYTEKGISLHDAILLAGYTLLNIDGVFVAEDSLGNQSLAIDSTVQAIIDAYDELPDSKAIKKLELKNEGLSRIQLLFPPISGFDELALVREQWLSMASAARSPTVNFQKMIDIYSAGLSGISAINALTTVTNVQNYDVVNTPAWP